MRTVCDVHELEGEQDVLRTRATLDADIGCKDRKRDRRGRPLSATSLQTGPLTQWRKLAEALEDPPLTFSLSLVASTLEAVIGVWTGTGIWVRLKATLL